MAGCSPRSHARAHAVADLDPKPEMDPMTKPLLILVCAPLALALPLSSHADITTGLMARYPFSGNADDVSGNGNHATVEGAATLTADRFGVPNSAFDLGFNNSSSYLWAPSSPSLSAPTTAVTQAAWIYMSDATGWNPILMKSISGENAFMYRMLAASTYVCVAYGNWNIAACTGATIPLNEWHHVATTFNGSSVRFFVDGVPIHTAPLVVTMTPDTRPLAIGFDYPGLPEYFKGKLDDVALYARALSESDILELYSDATSVPGPQAEGLLVMSPPFPNPTRGGVSVDLDLPVSQPVRLGMYDASGRIVGSLFDGALEHGRHALRWNAEGLASGVYFLRLESAGGSQVSKVVLAR
jgi:hypothetical protein